MPIGSTPVWQLGLYLLVLVVGPIATWYYRRVIRAWAQRFQDWQNLKDVSDARARVQADQAKENEESDRLRAIDGR